MKHIGLFEGIGGFSLAARWMGWETVAWCEWNEFGQRVLRYHFPEAIGHGDITKTDFTPYANTIDILTGGFPCQPYSAAGKRRGKEDDRHLWPEMLRAIREIAPRYVVGENVLGLVNWNGGMVFDEVCANLEAEGYEVTPVVIPAAAVNAPHGRDRVWFIARRTTPDTEGANDRQQNRTDNTTGPTISRWKPKVWLESSGYGDCWPTPDTDSDGRQWTGQGTEIQAGWEQRSEQSRQLEGGFEGLCVQGAAPDTESIGSRRELSNLERQDGAQQQSQKQGQGQSTIGNIGSIGPTMHTNSTSESRQYISNERKRQSNRPNSRDGIVGFENFPTQSPVCGGDDGLPRQLDGITFPKWRAESIKAYGNAIVPQVAYELFKAIELYENTNRP